MRKFFILGLFFSLSSALFLTSCKKEKKNDNDKEYPSTAVILRNAVSDIDGNSYDAVQIGSQIWMAENLRTSRYADGAEIPLGPSSSTTSPYRYNPNNDVNNVSTYGYLYNWPAIMHGESGSDANPSGVQGICPNGWHVPSIAEWKQLTNYVGSQSQYICGNDTSYIAKAISATTGWYNSMEPCAVGNDLSANNATGFSALPAGDFRDGYYNFFGETASFWSATDFSGSDYGIPFTRMYYLFLYLHSANVQESGFVKDYGLSVRCVRD